MTIFAVSSDTGSSALKERLKLVFGIDDFLVVDNYLCLVSTDKSATAEDIFNKINNGNPLATEFGNYIVFTVNSYYGFHVKTVWEWMQAKGV